ncbi:hypothetical protein [Haloferula sp. BvORR071]|uniref:hypothetical protein n=1 Tax=Haloferula sp. BvORR071 TaxID=1396141 RepID=UPI00054F86D1|nr:hypothetical protein [Haloferula sp. BvORR071]
MTLSPELLDHLHASDRGSLARECDGHFSLSELEEAAHSGVASLDLAEWLGRHRQITLADADGPEPIAHHTMLTAGSREDAPSPGTERNYQDGPADL